jgi:hypothetical protein
MINRKIVAWARWHYPRVLSEEERKQDGDPDLFDQVIPEGSNMALCEDLFEKLEWAEHTFVDREFGFCLFSTFPFHISPRFPYLLNHFHFFLVHAFGRRNWTDEKQS